MVPDVSFVIPTFNRAYILDKAIKSVFNQSSDSWEIIVVDDGSTDNTKELVNKLNNSKIKYIYQKNNGPSAARNSAFPLVSGEWIAYIDSDNELLPNYLEEMLNAVKANPEKLYFLPKGKRTLELYEDDKLIKTIDDSADFLDNISVKDIFMRNFHFDGNGFMHSIRIIKDGFLWDENLRLMEEWDFVMSISDRYPEGFCYVPKILFNYHQRFGTDGLVSNASYLDWANAFEYIYQKHKDSKLMIGQSWYPNRVEKYKKLQKDLEEGKAPEPHLRYFSKF